jgi:hypothetical protein
MRDQWTEVDRKLLDIGLSRGKINDLLNEQLDSLLYLSDIFQINNPDVSRCLADAFLRLLALPLIAGSLGAERRYKEHLGIPAATYFLVQIFTHIKHSSVVNTLLVAMFLPQIPASLHAAIQGHPPLPPASYSYECSALHSSDVEVVVLVISDLAEVTDLTVESADDLGASLQANSVRDIFVSYLRSKDNNLILLTLLVIQAVLDSPLAHESLVAAAGLTPHCQPKKHLQPPSFEDPAVGSEDQSEAAAAYDTSLMDSLIKLFDTEPIFRTATYRLAVKLVVLLAYRPDLPHCLLPQDKFALDLAYKSVLLKLKRILHKEPPIDQFMEFFEEEWLKTSKFTTSEVTPCPSSLLIPIDDQATLNIPFPMRVPVGDSETARCLLAVFFSLGFLRLTMSQRQEEAMVYPLECLNCEWAEGQVQPIGKH